MYKTQKKKQPKDGFVFNMNHKPALTTVKTSNDIRLSKTWKNIKKPIRGP